MKVLDVSLSQDAVWLLGGVGAALLNFLSYNAGLRKNADARKAQAAADFRKAISNAEAELPANRIRDDLGETPVSWEKGAKTLLKSGLIAVQTIEPYLSSSERQQLHVVWREIKNHCATCFGPDAPHNLIFEREERLEQRQHLKDLLSKLRAIASNI